MTWKEQYIYLLKASRMYVLHFYKCLNYAQIKNLANSRMFISGSVMASVMNDIYHAGRWLLQSKHYILHDSFDTRGKATLLQQECDGTNEHAKKSWTPYKVEKTLWQHHFLHCRTLPYPKHYKISSSISDISHLWVPAYPRMDNVLNIQHVFSSI